ncbi:MAG: substrate-binding domain-containing protein [Pseudomonadota bacterium]
MTLKDLARHLGLSPTTVSRALNGYPEVNAQTRARVKDAAHAMGYVPNIGAQRLATGRAKTIGHVVSLDDHEIINPFFAEFVAGAGEAYAAAGYEMTLSVCSQQTELDIYRSMAARRSVDGVILHNVRRDDERIPLLQSLGLPFVVHGRVAGNEHPYTYLDISNDDAFATATEHLIALGHTRIALLNGLTDLSFAQRREDGVHRALAGAGIAPVDTLFHSAEMSDSFGYLKTQEMLRLPHPPTAILTASILTAMGAARALSDAGLQMGKDVSVLTHDDVLSYMSNGVEGAPVFTATVSSIRAAGSKSAQMLLKLINTPAAPPVSQVWDTELIIGPSTGPAPT